MQELHSYQRKEQGDAGRTRPSFTGLVGQSAAMRIIVEKFLMVLVLAAGRIGYWLIDVSYAVARWLRALGW